MADTNTTDDAAQDASANAAEAHRNAADAHNAAADEAEESE